MAVGASNIVRRGTGADVVHNPDVALPRPKPARQPVILRPADAVALREVVRHLVMRLAVADAPLNAILKTGVPGVAMSTRWVGACANHSLLDVIRQPIVLPPWPIVHLHWTTALPSSLPPVVGPPSDMELPNCTGPGRTRANICNSTGGSSSCRSSSNRISSKRLGAWWGLRILLPSTGAPVAERAGGSFAVRLSAHVANLGPSTGRRGRPAARCGWAPAAGGTIAFSHKALETLQLLRAIEGASWRRWC
mmetsp:Transcript_66917/g.217707  ORF Transcript_66917/g.217707 Transcript_66917/m.217707 type:complete len:250 (-) Transcript_66917:289-1038(-)